MIPVNSTFGTTQKDSRKKELRGGAAGGKTDQINRVWRDRMKDRPNKMSLA